MGDDTWTVTVAVAPGTYKYRFVNGGPALAGILEPLNEADHADCTVTEDGFTNRQVEIQPGDAPIVLDTICFGYCVSCDEIVTIEEPSRVWDFKLIPNITKNETTLWLEGEWKDEVMVRWYGLDGRPVGASCTFQW